MTQLKIFSSLYMHWALRDKKIESFSMVLYRMKKTNDTSLLVLSFSEKKDSFFRVRIAL